MTDSTERVLEHFPSRQEVGPGQYEAICPAHDDTRASLSIGIGEDGTVLLKCHAGCNVSDVTEAVGLTLKDLFPKPNGNGHNNGHAKQNSKPRIVATYDYRDEQRELEFQAVRFDPKDFKQRKPKEGGGWDWRVKGCRPLVYRLPELLVEPHRTVAIVEGEKDVENLARIGVLATCNAGGAEKWRKSHAEFLRGRNVVVIPDNDDAGRRHAEQVTKSLCGTAKSVKVLELPGLPPKGDVSDWIAAGGTKAELARLTASTPGWTPPTPKPRAEPTGDVIALREIDGRTDAANSKRFAADHRNDARFVGKWNKWVLWCRLNWKVDEGVQVDTLAKETAAKLYEQATQEIQDDD
ncbi:MAG: toprim domain-containing protein [Pirellulales bacterium]